MHQVVERQDTPETRGMIHKVRHLGKCGVEQWRRKAQAAREGSANVVSTSGEPAAKARRSFTLSICSRRRARASAKCASAAAWVPSLANRGFRQQGSEVASRLFAPPWFEGGQMPLHRRMPKRGFHNPFGVSYSGRDLAELNVFRPGET